MNCRVTAPALVLLFGLTLVFAHAGPALAQDDDIGNPEKAIKRFSEAVKKAPEDSQSWYNLGLAYLKAGKLEDAASAAAKATSLNDKSPKNLQLEGNIAMKRSKSAEAITAYAKARDLETQDGGKATLETLSGLAQAYFNREQWDDAIEAYKQAWRLVKSGEEGDLGALNNQLGAAYLKKGDTDEAVKWFEMNVTAAPDNANNHYNLGMTYRKVAAGGESAFWEKAATAFRRSADLSPGDALAQFFAGEALLIVGRKGEAVSYLDKYLKGDPDGKKAVATFGAMGKTEVFEAAKEYKAEALK